jgi:ferritin-like metal-binding protein YciE
LLSGPFGRKNKAVDKMLKDAKDFSKMASTPELRDAILIASLQGINLYKISAYNTAVAFSSELGLDQVTELLAEVLAWEKNTNKALSKIALKGVNKKGAALSASPYQTKQKATLCGVAFCFHSK